MSYDVVSVNFSIKLFQFSIALSIQLHSDLFVCLFTWGLSSLLDWVNFKRVGTSLVLFRTCIQRLERVPDVCKGLHQCCYMNAYTLCHKGIPDWPT